MQVDVALEGDGAGEPCSGGNDHSSATFVGAAFDEAVDHLGVEIALCVGFLAVVKQAVIFVTEFRGLDLSLHGRINVFPGIGRGDGWGCVVGHG